MRKLFNLTLGVIIGISLCSCQKEAVKTPAPYKAAVSSPAQSLALADCERKWYGMYMNGVETNDTVPAQAFISKGMAQLSPVKWYNYFTVISYPIPPCKQLDGDNIRLNAMVRNTAGLVGSVIGNDIVLQVTGENGKADIYLTAIDYLQNYAHITIGSTQYWNLPELVHYFKFFQLLTLETKRNNLNVYIDGELVKTVPYPNKDRIGNIESISITFKGTGAADYVKMYNSTTNALIMQEDFNLEGKTNVQWF